MTHVLRAHGLFNTAADAVAHMHVRLDDTAEVTNLRNKLHHRECLDTADRAILISCVKVHKLELTGQVPWNGKTVAECDKIIALAQ